MKKNIKKYLSMETVRPPWYGYPREKMLLKLPPEWDFRETFYTEKKEMDWMETIGEFVTKLFRNPWFIGKNQPPLFIMIEREREYLLKHKYLMVYNSYQLIVPVQFIKNAEQRECHIIGQPKTFVVTIREKRYIRDPIISPDIISSTEIGYYNHCIGCEEEKVDSVIVRSLVQRLKGSLEAYDICLKDPYQDIITRKIMKQVLYECAGIGNDASALLSAAF